MEKPFLTITVPGDPIAKGRPRFVRYNGNVRTYTPERTAVYEREIAILASLEMEGEVLTCPVRVEVEAIFSLPRAKLKPNQQPRPDVDNILKIVGDGLNKIVWADDQQIQSASVTKKYGQNSEMIIRVWKANQI